MTSDFWGGFGLGVACYWVAYLSWAVADMLRERRATDHIPESARRALVRRDGKAVPQD